MENNNGKGQNILYLVVGIATLVVAIIGATFAYFSAQASAGADVIEGGTNTGLSTALSLAVERVTFGEVATPDGDEGTGETPVEPDYNDLVPAIIDVTTEGVAKAVNEKCVAGGYTGCHLYKITASSSQTLDNVSIRLAKLETTATDTASWSYVLYNSADGTEGTVSSIVGNGDFKTLATSYPYIENEASGFDMHNNDTFENKLTGDNEDGTKNPVYYYLLVYLANKDDQSQNPEDTSNEHSGTGTYSGLITMDAAGGKVVASFSTTTGV